MGKRGCRGRRWLGCLAGTGSCPAQPRDRPERFGHCTPPSELQPANLGERRVDSRVQAKNFRPQRCRALRAMHDTFARKVPLACAQHGEPCVQSPEPHTARLSTLAANRESLARKVGERGAQGLLPRVRGPTPLRSNPFCLALRSFCLAPGPAILAREVPELARKGGGSARQGFRLRASTGSLAVDSLRPASGRCSPIVATPGAGVVDRRGGDGIKPVTAPSPMSALRTQLPPTGAPRSIALCSAAYSGGNG